MTDLQPIKTYYNSSVEVMEAAKNLGEGHVITSACQTIMDLCGQVESLERKIAAQEATIQRMKETMRDCDIRCVECNGELSESELEEGYCLSCSRHLS